MRDLIDKIDACLPQTQCGECGYPGCRPYAAALAHGQATIDHCPPGGLKTLLALAEVLQHDPKPFEAKVAAQTKTAQTAIIDATECIGCTKCLPACPVDAIIGSSKQLHQVLAHECTGCGLCVDPCPVDCIEMVPVPKPQYQPDIAKARHQAKHIRTLQAAHQKEQTYQQKRHAKQTQNDQHVQTQSAKRDYIAQAMSRVAAKQNQKKI